jgi:predicted membrane protein
VAASDRRRTWLWWFLAVVAASQLYFFRELLAAFAIFTIAFAAVACVAVSLYMLIKCGELALARFSAFRHPAENLTPTRNPSPAGGIAAIIRGTENAA